MNWTKILADAGIPEPPGRQEAVDASRKSWQAKQQAKTAPRNNIKTAKGLNND